MSSCAIPHCACGLPYAPERVAAERVAAEQRKTIAQKLDDAFKALLKDGQGLTLAQEQMLRAQLLP